MPQPKRKRHGDEEWEKHRAVILTKYIHDKLTLEQVRTELEKQGFSVSSHQLEYRCKIWGFNKNLNRATWQHIDSVLGKQSAKERHLFWKGQPLNPRRVIKETNRHRLLRPDLESDIISKKLPIQSVIAVSQGGTRGNKDHTAPWFQGPSRSSNFLRKLLSFEGLQRHPAHDGIGKAELNAIMEVVSNGLIRQWYNGLNLQSLINKLYNLVEFFRLANLNSDADSMTCQAAVHSLWETIFYRCLGDFENFGNRTDDDDRRFLVVVKWLLATTLESWTLFPSLCKALDASLRSGHVEVASLLWGMTTPSQRSNLQLRSFDLRRISLRRSKEAVLLLRRMLSIDSPELALLTLKSISQYSSLDVFRTLLESASALFAQPVLLDGWINSSSQLIRSTIIGCAGAEPEDMGYLKLQAVYGHLSKLGLSVSADYINAETFMAAAMRGHVKILMSLASVHPNLGITDGRGFSALHAAAEFGELEVCKQILRVSPPEQHNTDALILTLSIALLAAHLEICRVLEYCLRGSDMEHFTAAEWRNLLCSCAHSQGYNPHPYEYSESQEFKFWSARLLINSYIRNPCVICCAALKACVEGLPELLKFCLDHGSDPISRYRKFVLRFVPPISLLDVIVGCPLMDFSLARLNLDQGPPPFTSSLPDSELPRTFARYLSVAGSVTGRMDCVKLLFQHGMQPHKRHVMMSLLVGEWDMAQLLFQQGVGPDMEMLEAAICSQDDKSIQNTYSWAGNTYHTGALCAAVLFSQECALSRDIALDLISQRSPHDPCTVEESTAISLAAMHNDQEILSKLFNNIKGPFQLSYVPDCFCDTYDESWGLDFLYETIYQSCAQGEPFWQFGSIECSPLALAVLSNSSEATLALLRHGIRPDSFACNMAVLFNCHESLALLLSGQPPLCQWVPSPELEYSPLCYAIKSTGFNYSVGNLDVDTDFDADCYDNFCHRSDFLLVSQLLSAGADINGIDTKRPHDRSPLQMAAEYGKLSIAKYLLDQGAHVNGEVAKEGGATALQLAVMRGHTNMIQMLLAYGADINAPAAPMSGLTCLQGVVGFGRFSILELLIKEAVKIDGEHRVDYVLAVCLAKADKHPVVVKRLISYGGWTEWDEAVSRGLSELKGPLEDVSNADKAEVEARVNLKLSRNSGAEDDQAELHVLSLEQTGSSEASISQDFAWPQCIPISPQSRMGQWLVPPTPQRLAGLDMSTPPPCLDDEAEWLHHRGPSFMRESREYQVGDDEVWELD